MKGKSWKFWITFWILSALFLCAWAIFWNYRNHGKMGLLKMSRPIMNVLPIKTEQKKDLLAVVDLLSQLALPNQEKTFLILFQNNMELRPGGGFIGAFGILKIKDEKVTFIDTHDNTVFDSRIETGIVPPYPMGRLLNIKDWEMRDSNWSPDFAVNAQKAEYFYQLQGGQEKIDGVVAISADVLTAVLEIVGPVSVPNYPGEYNSQNAILKLEYQVERGYKEQGIEKGKRKYIMKDLAKELIFRAQELSWSKKSSLAQKLEQNLKNKDIMLYFKDDTLQDKMRQIGWSGEVKNAEQDYLMTVDANLAALKSDLYIKRSLEYIVDLSKEKPEAKLAITYEHTAKVKDWMTSDYQTYLRIYVPEGAWLKEVQNGFEQSFGNELGKKYFGTIVNVPIGQKKTVIFSYDLPVKIKTADYSLLLQKQSGLKEIPVKITIVKTNGQKITKDLTLTKDEMLVF